MNQIFAKILADYKKASKTYKKSLIAKYGYTTEKEFLESLGEEEKPEPKVEKRKPTAKKQVVHLVDILDASGSMQGNKIANANEAIAKDVSNAAKENDVDYTYTLVSFSDADDVIYHQLMKNIKEANTPNVHTRGMTALYSTIAEVLQKMMIKTNIDDKVLVKIYTDGGENRSTGEFKDPKNLSELIKQAESRGFTITFIGTVFDVETIIDRISIDRTNTMSYDGTASGLKLSMTAASSARESYSKALVRGEDVSKDFFKRVGKL